MPVIEGDGVFEKRNDFFFYFLVSRDIYSNWCGGILGLNIPGILSTASVSPLIKKMPPAVIWAQCSLSPSKYCFQSTFWDQSAAGHGPSFDSLRRKFAFYLAWSFLPWKRKISLRVWKFFLRLYSFGIKHALNFHSSVTRSLITSHLCEHLAERQ